MTEVDGSSRMRARKIVVAMTFCVTCVLAPAPARASGSAAHSPAADSSAHAAGRSSAHPMSHDMAGMDMPGMDMNETHAAMPGLFGAYAMTREASGTSWQPEAAAHGGLHLAHGEWMFMLHGAADVVYDNQAGPRGDAALVGDNMLMAMARRAWGPGTLGLRAMASAEPATMPGDGYPLLLQTGETANGRDPLIDRQHPHDLFMELATSYSVASGDRSLFVYGGLPGEPALGPPAFMHRFSGRNIPAAPITHHWLDSTHISYGVLTAGAVVDKVKVEGSLFRGREPDQRRWDIESPRLDSHAVRLSVNPGPAWALQLSEGRLHSPEQLEPGVDQDRTTASAMYDRSWTGGSWEATAAWGRDRERPGHTLDAYTVEASATVADTHTLFARAERVQKSDLFRSPDPRAGRVFEVGELSGGYRRDLGGPPHASAGIGALATLALVPGELRDAYGRSPVSLLVFLHLALR